MSGAAAVIRTDNVTPEEFSSATPVWHARIAPFVAVVDDASVDVVALSSQTTRPEKESPGVPRTASARARCCRLLSFGNGHDPPGVTAR